MLLHVIVFEIVKQDLKFKFHKLFNYYYFINTSSNTIQSQLNHLNQFNDQLGFKKIGLYT